MKRKVSLTIDEMVMRELEEIARQTQRGKRPNVSRVAEEALRKGRHYL